MFRFYLIQPNWILLRKNSNKTPNPGNASLLFCLKWHVRLRIGISKSFIPGIVAHGMCYISDCFNFFTVLMSAYLLVLVLGFLGFIALYVSLSSQQYILLFLFRIYCIMLYYIIILYSIALFYVIIFLLSTFWFSSSFHLGFCIAFTVVFNICVLLFSIIIISTAISLEL